MPRYGTTSKTRLAECDQRIQDVFNEVIKYTDCKILEGFRGQERQDFLFDSGQSEVQWPDGKHNSKPSKGIDAVPYPVDWENKERFILFAGFVLGIAQSMGIKLYWGGDWNRDWNTKDHKFFDGPHFELRD